MNESTDWQKRITKYLDNIETVHGWLHSYSAKFIADLAKFQCEARISGALGEIGVHMGRLFIILKLTAGHNERCFAIDVFSDQHLNVENSGFGNRDVFLSNVQRWTGDSDIIVIQASSLSITPDDILNAVGKCRLVSIDGGHTEELVYSDLRLVEASLNERGVAILDDFFNQSWPGVAAGAAKYFLNRSTKIRPFAISPNKVYLATEANHTHYRSFIQRRHQKYFEKTVRIFGNDVDVFGCRLTERLLPQLARNMLRRTLPKPGAHFAEKLLRLRAPRY